MTSSGIARTHVLRVMTADRDRETHLAWCDEWSDPRMLAGQFDRQPAGDAECRSERHVAEEVRVLETCGTHERRDGIRRHTNLPAPLALQHCCGGKRGRCVAGGKRTLCRSGT